MWRIKRNSPVPVPWRKSRPLANHRFRRQPSRHKNIVSVFMRCHHRNLVGSKVGVGAHLPSSLLLGHDRGRSLGLAKRRTVLRRSAAHRPYWAAFPRAAEPHRRPPHRAMAQPDRHQNRGNAANRQLSVRAAASNRGRWKLRNVLGTRRAVRILRRQCHHGIREYNIRHGCTVHARSTGALDSPDVRAQRLQRHGIVHQRCACRDETGDQCDSGRRTTRRCHRKRNRHDARISPRRH